MVPGAAGGRRRMLWVGQEGMRFLRTWAVAGRGSLPLTFSLMNKDARLHLLSLQDLRFGGGQRVLA